MKIKDLEMKHIKNLTDCYGMVKVIEINDRKKILLSCGNAIASITGQRAVIHPKHLEDWDVFVIREFLTQNNFKAMMGTKFLKCKYAA